MRVPPPNQCVLRRDLLKTAPPHHYNTLVDSRGPYPYFSICHWYHLSNRVSCVPKCEACHRIYNPHRMYIYNPHRMSCLFLSPASCPQSLVMPVSQLHSSLDVYKCPSFDILLTHPSNKDIILCIPDHPRYLHYYAVIVSSNYLNTIPPAFDNVIWSQLTSFFPSHRNLYVAHVCEYSASELSSVIYYNMLRYFKSIDNELEYEFLGSLLVYTSYILYFYKFGKVVDNYK